MKKIIVLIMFLSMLSNPCLVMSYDDKVTHPAVTEAAIKISSLATGKYLSTNLGNIFSKDFDSDIDGLPVIKYFSMGSTEEDSPNCRAASHFLNPLRAWGEAGLSDTNETILGALIINPSCFVTAPFSSRFSIHKYADVSWATGYTSPTQLGGETGNEMDWNAARKSYFLALTATKNAARELYFAQTFQALGQVMHLVQDMAVPAHVRNDFTAHLAFQKADFSMPSTWYGNTYEWYVKNNSNIVNTSLTNIEVVTPPNGLLTALWDANAYNGGNPSTSSNQGLAEYTNANFFSESTIFAELKDPTDIHYFPRPNKADTNALEQEFQASAMEVTAEDGVQDRTIYVTKNNSAYKIAAYSFLGKRVARKIVADGIAPFRYVNEWGYNLDDEVYKDYAKELLPRAAGYSAGLVDYFFRGEINMEPDSGSPGQYVIKNKSNEAMSGIFGLYYDDASGNRTKAAEWVLTVNANGQSTQVTFTVPGNAKEAGKYMLVFNGRLGQEEGAVIGKAVELKDDLDIRVVTVSNFYNKWEDRRGRITVFTNKGIIYGQVPKEIFPYGIEKVRFDKSNPNHIAILASTGKSLKICIFKIDIDNKTINYEKTIYEQDYISYSETSEALIDCNVKIVRNNSSRRAHDFYLDNTYLKLLYVNYSHTEESLQKFSYDDDSDSGCSDHIDYHVANIYIYDNHELYYGENKIASITQSCTGGLISNGGFYYKECTNESNPNIDYIPITIFNKNDYAYGIYNGGRLVSVETSLPFNFSKYIVNGNIGLSNLFLTGR